MPLRTLSTWMEPPLDIVVLQDDTAARNQLVQFFCRPNILARGVGDGDELDAELRNRPPHVLIVDLDLPCENGFNLCQRVRSAFDDMGIIILAARSSPTDRIAGYQHGADFYLGKPANLRELEAIVYSLSRRTKPHVNHHYQLDIPRGALMLPHGDCIALTHWESRFLYELALAPDKKLSVNQLIDRLYERRDTLKLKENLPVMISRLRNKIEQKGGNDFIKAIRGFGYQLNLALTVRA